MGEVSWFRKVCLRHCSVCEGMDHHWMPDVDDDTGEPVMACKHCEAVRPMEAGDGQD